MAKKKTRRAAKLNWVVITLVALVSALCILRTLEDKYQMGLGLPGLQLPSLTFLYEYIEDIADDLSQPENKDSMDNALAVSGPLADSPLTIHVLDMGQADSVLIRSPGMNVLIDAGENDQGALVLRYLEDLGIGKLDIVIGTHPHSDHIGGLDTVISGTRIGKVILPAIPDDLVPTTQTYTDLLTAIDGKGLRITVAQPGMELDLGDGVIMTLLGPLEDYEDLNDMSVITRVDYGDTAFLFTGDAEARAELDLAERWDLKADVLKLSHHGSKTSSAAAFLDAVSPSVGVISCGLDNSYGHPHSEVMERLAQRDIEIYRTDLMGTVVLRSDGRQIAVSTEK